MVAERIIVEGSKFVGRKVDKYTFCPSVNRHNRSDLSRVNSCNGPSGKRGILHEAKRTTFAVDNSHFASAIIDVARLAEELCHPVG